MFSFCTAESPSLATDGLKERLKIASKQWTKIGLQTAHFAQSQCGRIARGTTQIEDC
jgi:hypothetical protein